MSDEFRSEWVDGEVLLRPPVTGPHSTANFRLMLALDHDLHGAHLYADVGVRMPRNRVRAPDLMAVTRPVVEGFAEEVPILAVEILSPATRGKDLLVKASEYAAFGVGQYWLVDSEARSIQILLNRDGASEERLLLDEAQPTGEVQVGEYGLVRLDLDEIVPLS
jgi:Uma2 family endonuclease